MKRPTKTDCARFLNEHGREVRPVSRFWSAYESNCHKSGKVAAGNFGYWLREFHKPEFESFFKHFQAHPELMEEVYGS